MRTEIADQIVEFLHVLDANGRSIKELTNNRAEVVDDRLQFYFDGQWFSIRGEDAVKALREYAIRKGLTKKNDREWWSSRGGNDGTVEME